MATQPGVPATAAPPFSHRGYTSASISRDAAGDVTVRVPLYAAGHPGWVLACSAFLAFGCVMFAVEFYPVSRFAAWVCVPITLEFGYLWLGACFGYKTSVIRANHSYEQHVTFLPSLVGAQHDAQAICFGKITGYGRFGKFVMYPVRVRLKNGHAYDLVWDAGTIDAAQTLAQQISDLTGLPVEPAIPSTTSTGMAKLAAIAVALALFPVAYNIFAYTAVPQKTPAPPVPDIRATTIGGDLVLDLDDLAPPYAVDSLSNPLRTVKFTTRQKGSSTWQVVMPIAQFAGKPEEQLEIDGVDARGYGWGRFVSTRGKLRKNQY